MADAARAKSIGYGVVSAVVATAVALVVYVVFGQDVFYKTDGTYLVYNLAEGRIEHPYNVLYMPLIAGLDAVLAPLELIAYDVGVALSALGTAVGVGLCAFGLARLGVSRGEVWLTTALVACCPPVFFFATVVEHHGPFFAFAALCFVVTVEFLRRPSWIGAVAFAASTHVAYMVHGTGNLLPAILLSWFLARRWQQDRDTWRRDLGLATAAGVIHVALWWFLKDVELPGDGGTTVFAQLAEEGIGRPRGIENLPAVTWQEWLRPYLPLSAVWLIAFTVPRLRLEAWALIVGLIPFLVLCLLLLVDEPEFGAYLLPLAIPAAHLTVRALRHTAALALIVISLGLAIGTVLSHDDRTEYRSWAAGVVEAADGQPYVLLLGGTREISFCLRELPDAERFVPSMAAATSTTEAELFTTFDAYVAGQQQAGKRVFLTAGAVVDLGDPAIQPFGAALVRHVVDRAGVTSVEIRGFRALRLTP